MNNNQINPSSLPPGINNPPPVANNQLPINPSQPKKSNKPLILLLSGIIFMSVAVVTVSILSQFTARPSKSKLAVIPTPTAKLLGVGLVIFEGETEYEKGSEGWKTPQFDTVLTEGDRVRVLSTGRAVINFDDGSVIRLNANSTIRLVSLKPDRIEVANEKGEVYARVVKSQRIFLVTDGQVKYESLGTAYKTVNVEGEKDVEVYHSQVKVSEGIKSVVVDEGNRYSPETEKTEKIVLTDLTKDEFVKWNKAEDEKTTEFKNELGVLEIITEPTPTVVKSPPTPTIKPEAIIQNSKLSLSVQKVDNGVRFNWNIENISAPQGFKIIKSESLNPVYPGNDYQYISDPGKRDFVWELKDGKSYHFRICVYTGEGCSVYSNDVESATPVGSSQTGQKVTSITVKSEGGNNISWILDGYSEKGFKVVWSKNPGPTYPLRDGDKYDYFDNPAKRDDTLSAFSGSGKYYIRICEYLGGSCGLYSNQIEVDL